MITPTGTVKTSTRATVEMQRELNRPSLILGIVYIVCGAVMVAADIMRLVVSVINSTEDDGEGLFIFLGILLITVGSVLLFKYTATEKAATANEVVDETEFFSTHMITRAYVNGEHVATAKLYYGRVVRQRETANYVFIYTTQSAAVGIDKRQLSPTELSTVKSLLASRALPPASEKGNCSPSAEVDGGIVAPSDPFDGLGANAAQPTRQCDADQPAPQSEEAQSPQPAPDSEQPFDSEQPTESEQPAEGEEQE